MPFYIFYSVHDSALPCVYILQPFIAASPSTCKRITPFITAPPYMYMYTYYNVHYSALIHVFILQRLLQRPLTTFATWRTILEHAYLIKTLPLKFDGVLIRYANTLYSRSTMSIPRGSGLE